MPNRLAKLLTPRDRGNETEQACRKYLQRQGLAFLQSNYRCRRGEIDLIMQDGDTIVFVEVRYRKNNRYGSAFESVTADKQRKLRMTAEYFLQERRKNDCCGRFDVVAVSQNSQNNKPTYSFEWIQNAF